LCASADVDEAEHRRGASSRVHDRNVQAKQELEPADPASQLDTQQHVAQASDRAGEPERQERRGASSSGR